MKILSVVIHTKDTNVIKDAVRVAIEGNIPFFSYRLPNNDACYFAAQISPLKPYTPNNPGFLLAPFDGNQNKTIFIRPELIVSQSGDIRKLSSYRFEAPVNVEPNRETSYKEYCCGANSLISDMKNNRYQKAVLSRVVDYKTHALENLDKWFVSLCKSYPEAFVFIVSVPGVTLWMGATPEQYIDYDGENLRTMALAATRRRGEKRSWTTKEEREQQIVLDYLTDLFSAYNLNISPRFVLQSGMVEHLCNKIIVNNVSKDDAFYFVSKMHPTPAVGGLPYKASIEAIKAAENRSRRYYAGYLGPIFENNRFSLFVNLRCMELFFDRVQLYLGGGLTSDSIVESEWVETENKADTLLTCIR